MNKSGYPNVDVHPDEKRTKRFRGCASVARPDGRPGSVRSWTGEWRETAKEAHEDFLGRLSPTAEPTTRRTLRFTAHIDDYAPGQAGPKTRKVSASKAKRIRAEHNRIHAYLTEMEALRPGDEIKTSRDDLRSVLGAASHMHITALQEQRPVTARLFVNQDVDSFVEVYIWESFNVEVISITLPEGS